MVAHQEHKGDDHANPETVYIDTDVERNLPYLKKVMENAVAGIRNSTEGNRNQNLFKQAAGVAAFVASGQLSEEEVFPLLEAAAKEAGLEEREIKSTLQSALAHGRKHPRVAPPPHESPDMKSCFGGKTQNSVMPIFPRPPRIFPDNVQTMLEEACRAYTTPPPVAVATLLALLSALVGRRRGISPKSSWVEYGNLWIALVAPSGIGKSPLAKAFFKPLMDKDYEMDRAWRIARELYEEELLEYDKARKSKSPDAGFIAKPVEPVREQCLANDVTMEALADILNDNPGGILWYVDELSGMFSDFDKYSGKVGGTKDRLLSAYDCSKWDINRKDKSKNIYIPHACVGIYGGIQPKRLSTAFSQSDKDSGFLQRFILIGASIEKAPLLNSHEMSEESLALLKAIVKHLGTMTVFDGKAQSGDAPLVLKLDEGALRIFEDWHNRHVIQAHTHYANKDDALYSRAMKQRSIALRICLLLYCLEEAIKRDDFDDSVLAPGPIPEYTMLNAVLLTDWLASHSDICWGLLTNPDMEALSPIQQAVIRVVTDLEDAITADKGVIKVSDLKPLIEEETGMKITPQQLNQEAQKLDLQPGRSSSSRFFKVPPRVMDSLKHLANSVTSVTAAGIA